MTAKEYMEQTGFTFVPSHNPSNYPQSIGTAQEQALENEKFWQNQDLFRKYTSVDGALKKQIVTEVGPVFLSSLVDQLTGFGKVTALTMLQHIFFSYGVINEINLEENAVKIIGSYDPV